MYPRAMAVAETPGGGSSQGTGTRCVEGNIYIYPSVYEDNLRVECAVTTPGGDREKE
jgi:hypothetical protein